MILMPVKGVRFVAGWEGFARSPCGGSHDKASAYHDAVGVLTIGYGTTAADRPIPSGCITRAKARRWLRSSLNRKYIPHIPRRWRMRPQEIAALASFAYNLGPGAVGDPAISTLARRLESSEGKTFEKRKRIYREEMPKWVHAGGQVLQGLVKRRAAEVALACNGDYSGRP